MEGPASSITTEIATTSWQVTPLGSLSLMMRCTLAVREGSRSAITQVWNFLSLSILHMFTLDLYIGGSGRFD
jgi:hypothetical protein